MYHAKKILGLIGKNVDYSYSPFLHNVAAEILQIPYHYTIFNVASPELVPVALDGAKALGIAGFNVTIPYKQDVFRCMDKLSSEAEAVGAVNTVINNNGKLAGYNTDIAGIIAPLEPYRKKIEGRPVGIFGNGGAAMAAVVALHSSFQPSVINIFSRNQQNGRTLCDSFRSHVPAVPFKLKSFSDETAISNCTLLINATPIGTKGTVAEPDNRLLPADSPAIHENHIVFDMVYNPMNTPFLEMARQRGAQTIPGIEMLLSQASRSFEIWTGKKMPVEEVKTRLTALLAGRQAEP